MKRQEHWTALKNKNVFTPFVSWVVALLQEDEEIQYDVVCVVMLACCTVDCCPEDDDMLYCVTLSRIRIVMVKWWNVSKVSSTHENRQNFTVTTKTTEYTDYILTLWVLWTHMTPKRTLSLCKVTTALCTTLDNILYILCSMYISKHWHSSRSTITIVHNRLF